MPAGKQKEITVLRKLVEGRGFKVVPSGSGHWRVLDPKGRVITDENGPIILSGTSSEVRGRAMAVNRLMKAGVLLVDPWRPQGKKGETEGETGDDLTDQEIAAREAASERSRLEDQRRSDRTHALRERLEPVVVLLGGWDKRGTLRDLGIVAHYFADRSQLPGRWSSPDAASENADALRKGATLSESMASLWERLLDELEAWPDVTLRYMQLLREAKGLADPTIGAADLPAGAETEDERQQGPVARSSALALEIAFEMGVGRDDSIERARIVQLAQRVADLELEADTLRRAARAAEEATTEKEGNA